MLDPRSTFANLCVLHRLGMLQQFFPGPEEAAENRALSGDQDPPSEARLNFPGVPTDGRGVPRPTRPDTPHSNTGVTHT